MALFQPAPQPHNSLDPQARHVSEPVASLPMRLLSLLYPPRCVGCGVVDTAWCDRCHAEFMTEPIYNAAEHTPELLKGIATTGKHHGKVQHMIHALKYENGRELAPILGQRLATQLQQQSWQVDAVIAVPLHPDRYRERGYNQAQLLSEQVAQILNLDDLSHGLYRDHFTRSQVGLNRDERQANVFGAFRADPTIINDKTVLLIDDVFTTGSTLQACAQALLTGGAKAVYGLTLTAAA